jgi:hypothetical protein
MSLFKKLEFSRRQKIAILFFLLLLTAVAFVVSFYIFRNQAKPGGDEINNAENLDFSAINYSRVSFFNSSPDRATMNIPEKWEGSYRLQEEGERVGFYYLSPQGATEELFSLRKSRKPEDKKKAVCQKGELFFIVDRKENARAEGLKNFEQGFDHMIESLKCN